MGNRKSDILRSAYEDLYVENGWNLDPVNFTIFLGPRWIHSLFERLWHDMEHFFSLLVMKNLNHNIYNVTNSLAPYNIEDYGRKVDQKACRRQMNPVPPGCLS